MSNKAHVIASFLSYPIANVVFMTMKHGPCKAPGRYYRGGMTLPELFAKFPDDAAAEASFASVRWPDGPVCPKCDCGDVQYPTTHPTMPYRCRGCRSFFSVKTDTVMADSKLGYQTWAIGIYLFNTGIKGTSAMKFHRDLGTCYKTAWHLAHRIREAWSDQHEMADTADPPSISRSGRSICVWTGDQLRCFLDAMADHELYPLYLLAATTGMRRGEIAGLLWHGVDLDAARLTINQQIVSVQYQLIESDLKTPTSRRNIDLDPRTVTELRRHRRSQLEERMATGQRGDDGYVFAKPDGSPIHPDLISQTFERAVAKLDIPRIRLHDLRHTHATILLQQNVHPKVVSERLGHASVAFTMTVYQHVMPGLQAQAAAAFDAAVFGQS